MRFLIISALVAYAAAAPSHLVPFPVVAYQAVAIPSAVPTISPGDIHAAAIDAQVKAQDLAQAAADKAIEVNQQIVEDINVKAAENADLVKEQVVDNVWAAEDKKWQALDALKTAEAQLDGAVASQAVQLAKSAVGAAPLVVAPAPYVVPIIAPAYPAVYPGITAPIIKTIAFQPLLQNLVGEVKFEGIEAKTPEEPAKVEGTDSVAVEAKSSIAENSPSESVSTTEQSKSPAVLSAIAG